MPTNQLLPLLLLLLLLPPGGAGATATAPGTTRSFSRLKREEEPSSYLRWVPFEGTLPPDAVSNWNEYTGRLEYVCSTPTRGCNTGAHVPARGPFCFYPYGNWERSTNVFKVLVNVGGFEALGWVDDSFGNVPKNAVEGCPSIDVFVGRNRYGLGKVSKGQRAAFVMVDGEEVWDKWYQVLVVKKGPANVTVEDVTYNVSGAVERGEDVTLVTSTVRNEGCRWARRNVTLEEATETEHDWELDQSAFAAVRGVLRAALLTFNGTIWEATNVTDVPWVGGASAGQYVAHTHVVEQELRPRTACTVALEGRRWDVRVPFAARLTRDFGDGQPHRVAVTGWARSCTVLGVRPRVKECWPIADVPPCAA
ncbi:natterin-4-like [Patagioenas fasciata]|uniref:natterin-4-like n=1 Tax=Patagioenas fasciata TaxID=372321 RepID=UPI003A9A0F71